MITIFFYFVNRPIPPCKRLVLTKFRIYPKPKTPTLLKVVWCRGAESDCLHMDFPLLFQSFLWYRTISSPFFLKGAGRLYRIIVGTHLLVSTPFPQLEPCGTWLGIVIVIYNFRFPRIHPVFNPPFRAGGSKIQSTALPMSYPGTLSNPRRIP